MSTQKEHSEPHRQGTVASMSRREMLAGMAGAAAATIAAMAVPGTASAELKRVVKNGRINHSVCKWPYRKLKLDQLCEAAVKLGIKSVELLKPKELPTLKKYGLVCAMVNSHSFQRGINNKDNHTECLARIRMGIDAAAEHKFPNVITFSGFRNGIPDDVGLENAITAIKQVIGHAEKKKVNICIEILNSKVDHKGYMFDHMSWGVELCKKIGSERMKILYDIYHAQIMEGDIIRTLRDNKEYIGHYHTGGNPGRHEIDETQELYYPAIMRAIVETGFNDYVAQEFIPTGDPLTSLAEAIQICDV
ncbi:MAG TPA: hydroxypyruvate isomerase [Phycisphaerales bacterium]|nr:hydroxypyruvate isomerase [Phycisphaerales bacterium]